MKKTKSAPQTQQQSAFSKLTKTDLADTKVKVGKIDNHHKVSIQI